MRVSDRFWSQVDRSGRCWIWQGRRSPKGYGFFYFDGRRILAHRFAWEESAGLVPLGMELDHLCHSQCDGGSTCPHRACVNPAHLEPVTHVENVLRGNQARPLSATCKAGHLFQPGVRQAHGRRCLECHREHQRRYLARRAA